MKKIILLLCLGLTACSHMQTQKTVPSTAMPAKSKTAIPHSEHTHPGVCVRYHHFCRYQ